MDGGHRGRASKRNAAYPRHPRNWREGAPLKKEDFQRGGLDAYLSRRIGKEACQTRTYAVGNVSLFFDDQARNLGGNSSEHDVDRRFRRETWIGNSRKLALGS